MSDWNEAIEKAEKILRDEEDSFRKLSAQHADSGNKTTAANYYNVAEVLWTAAAKISSLKRPAEQDGGWMPIESAPKDGSLILLLSRAHTVEHKFDGKIEKVFHPARANLGMWNPEGDSWVDENGQLGGDCYELKVTGVWDSGGGWFQPNEVTHWAPLPAAPKAAGER